MQIRLYIIIILTVLLSCTDDKQKIGQDIVSKVENYKTTHGQLPDSLENIGIKSNESGPVYYQKQSDTTYIVWYGLGLGDSKTYDSVDKTWK